VRIENVGLPDTVRIPRGVQHGPGRVHGLCRQEERAGGIVEGSDTVVSG
jgi:hypothetical protein